MDALTKDILRKFDEPGAYEFPAVFDYDELERRARLVCVDVAQAGVQTGFEDSVYNQDASFSVAILLLTYVRNENDGIYQPCVRFSNFGNLATITWGSLVPSHIQNLIRASLANHGFTYLSADDLDADYDGVMPDKNTFRTWWIRYFDWL